MSGLTDFQEALKIIEDNPVLADFEGVVSDDDIAKSSSLIGLEFPPSYRAFLKSLGLGAFADAEFYGIIPNKVPGSSTPSMTWRTLEDRRTTGLPEYMIPVMSSGYGPLFCLDASKRSDDQEFPIVLWQQSDGSTNAPQPIAESFGEFFLREIKERLN